MNKQIFGEKLAHYASREPKEFLQMDSYYMPESNDDYMRPDVDGDVLIAKQTIELMNGSNVRVLIPYNADAKVVVRQMKKLAKWLKLNPDFIKLAKPEPEYTQSSPWRKYRDSLDDITC